MPDERKESRFLAMLERKGLIRKIGSADDQAESSLNIMWPQKDLDVRSILNRYAGILQAEEASGGADIHDNVNAISREDRKRTIERERKRHSGRSKAAGEM